MKHTFILAILFVCFLANPWCLEAEPLSKSDSTKTNEDSRALKHVEKRGMSPGQRLALVLGNANYTSSPLKNPVNDANIMAETLGRFGFDVIKGCDLSRNDMKRKVDEFGDRLKKGGIGLFYYAGHGMQVKGRNYLIPVDAQIKSEQDVEYEALDTGRVLAKMDAAKNSLNIVILDACRDNPFARSFRSVSHGLAHMDAPSGTLISYSTAPGSVASDGPSQNGLYTRELVKYMAVPGLKIEDVFKKVRLHVRNDSNNQQVPWESSSLEGDFYFLPPDGKPISMDYDVIPTPSVPASIEGVWKRTGKRFFTMEIQGDKAVIIDTANNRKVVGTTIMKNIHKEEGGWKADRAQISSQGKVKQWGIARLELKGPLLIEHLDFHKGISFTYEKIETE
ncbi:MAG: caspase family protein [Proteobacteria bacterium]|nr:caspase family protein [Pseudomonadota bacterium]